MEYLALYRKYRPKSLNEVVGQAEVKKILSSSISNGTISHAYLFSGPRGTGKTTMAKIMAKMVNCTSPVDGDACNKCDSCLNILNSNDIIEIDAASNNGVDEIRDLREKANLVPSMSKYKVYIIDEVHMLTTQAFNALLKTLEEPPKHVIFILATTEYYKIPLTITSRCQKFQFSKLTNDEIVDRLQEISKKEKIKIEDDALLEIAKISDGGMRDSINFLDQLRSFTDKKITLADVNEVCGDVSNQQIFDLLQSLKNSNGEFITSFFKEIDIKGKSYSRFLENFICFLKDVILYSKSVNIKYIDSNIDLIKDINAIFSIDEIFYITECVDKLFSKIKSVSRQSIVIVVNFLMIMNKLKNGINTVVEVAKIDNTENADNSVKYDMAFNFTSNDTEVVDNTKKEKVNDIKIDEENVNDELIDNKDIIINNCFAVADKEIKNTLGKLFDKVNDYLIDKKYKNVASCFVDTNIEVAGKEYILFSTVNNAIVDKIYKNYRLSLQFISTLFNENYNIAIVTKDEWNKLRDEYINRIKNGSKYEIKNLNINNIVENESNDNKNEKEKNYVDKLFDIVGEENIEFR